MRSSSSRVYHPEGGVLDLASLVFLGQVHTHSPRRRRLLGNHAGILEHIGPLARRARVAVLKVLAEVVGAEELLGRVALAELVGVVEVADALGPVLVRGDALALGIDAGPPEAESAVTACVGLARTGR